MRSAHFGFRCSSALEQVASEGEGEGEGRKTKEEGIRRGGACLIET